MFDWKTMLENFIFGAMIEAVIHWPIVFLLSCEYNILYILGILGYIGFIGFMGFVLYYFVIYVMTGCTEKEILDSCASLLGFYLSFYFIYTHPL